MDGRSCAELETVINEAGLYAGFERAEAITMDHFMEACLRTIFDVPAGNNDDYDDDDCDEECETTQQNNSLEDSTKFLSQIVYHEAGHAVVSEILCPESITLVSAHNRGGESGGFTDYYNDHSFAPLYWCKSRIIGALGGAAAIEQKFGIFDAGCDRDLDFAFDRTRDLVVNNCVCGLHLHNNRYEDSQRLWSEQEQAVSAEVEKYYRKAKEIISLNMEFFENVAAALAKKRLLSAVDIKQIKSECKITSVTL